MGPEWSTSTFPTYHSSHRAPSFASPLPNQAMGPEWGTTTFPTCQGSHRASSFAAPLHVPFPNSSERVPASYDNISAESKSEVDSEADPFHDIPELGDFNLSGAEVALCKQKYPHVPSTVSVATCNRHGD
ncbi:hypothetical protein ACOMHN_051470 [Nucella lapillus]